MPSLLRATLARMLVAVVLTLAMPSQWEAFCGGWQSPRQAMACCHRASHDHGPSAAFSCCAAQEQTRHAQPPAPALVLVQLVPVTVPVAPAALPWRRVESPRQARSVDSRLLASVFQV